MGTCFALLIPIVAIVAVFTFITAAAGAGSMIFLYHMIDRPGLYLPGLIPLLIGLVLAVYGFATPMPGAKR